MLSVELVIDSYLDISFEAPPGVTVLFGPSGAGKSRTLAAIAGLTRIDRGHVTLGTEVWFDAERALHRPVHERRVGFVFQSLALFPHMTAADNVAYGIERDGTKAERREKAIAMLEKMHASHLADRLPRTFSGGEAQRVALARAFAMSPRVLLLDEPFSALDASMKAELMSELQDQLQHLRVPTIFVTHQPEDAERLGERVVFIDRGRVVKTTAMSEGPFEKRDGNSEKRAQTRVE